MAGHICINCNSKDVQRREDSFTCQRCGFMWNVAMEQAAAIYLRGQGREPATSIFDVGEPTNDGVETLTDVQGQGGAPEVTTGDPVNVPPAEQDAAGGVEQLPDVPSDAPAEPPARGKKGG